MSTFAEWYDDEPVCVVTYDDDNDVRHETIATLGYADTRREATAVLTGAGWTPRGRWHCDLEGCTTRPVERG